MSLLCSLRPFSRSWHDDFDIPRSLLRFGMDDKDDFLRQLLPCATQDIALVTRRPKRPSQSSNISDVVDAADKFSMQVDVRHFSPEELSVKIEENCIVIHGKHEKSDEHGFISREFTRRYKLPEDVEPENVKSKLSSEGVLTLEAPKKEPPAKRQRTIPITVESRKPAESDSQAKCDSVKNTKDANVTAA